MDGWGEAEQLVLGPLPPPLRALPGGLGLARSAIVALQDARSLAKSRFATERARALFAGLAAHSMLPLERRPSAGFGIALGVLGHVAGWGFPRGGAQAIVDALAAELTVHASSPVDELPRAEVVLADIAPAELRRIARLPEALRPASRPLPARPGRVQARLGARWADPLARARVRPRRDRAYRRDVR